MARDRKKAKARQRRQQRTAPRPPVARRTDDVRAPDADGHVDESEVQPPKADARAVDADLDAPDPLDHASADVELAQAAETGAPPLEDDRDAQAEQVFDDELAPVPGGDGDRGRGDDGKAPDRERSPERPRAGGGRFLNFLRACVAELRRVQWPDRRQVTQATGVVLGFVIIAGAYLGLLDAVWSRVIDAIL
jgi:preprotein translocase SecE subunit